MLPTDVPGGDSPASLTSDQILDADLTMQHLPEMPESVIVVGGGIVGIPDGRLTSDSALAPSLTRTTAPHCGGAPHLNLSREDYITMRIEHRLAASLFAAIAFAGRTAAQTPARPTPNISGACSARHRWSPSASRYTANRSKEIFRDNLPDRGVIVYLPPSYATSGTRRYPVLYALHGYSISNEKWTTEIERRRRSRVPSRPGRAK